MSEPRTLPITIPKEEIEQFCQRRHPIRKLSTIARANRVFGNKVNGLIVDYIGVFRDLQKALEIYGFVSGGYVARRRHSRRIESRPSR
ncbi:hypothetical protein E5S67_03530 [Microcoleus sp. IPMA8]|uniref:Uncharacterized protein n=1 Tax=Microcoleus asticus IPMA8 TaxID=2563858 RepID=A0ABX2CZP1_9CYAN|nr:hypothetical protein [Microcoleus asticus IPMA8]